MGPGFESQRDHKNYSLEFQAFFMAFIYILYSEKIGKYYIGACENIERRLYEHNIGHSKFTSRGIPWMLKYTEVFQTLQEAKQRERKIKAMKSKKYIEELIAKGGASR